MKKVISASRRIDLVAHYPERMVSSLEEIGPENIHTLVVWTKNPLPLLQYPSLRSIIESIDSIVLHLTVTGLGGTAIEPGVPSWKSVLKVAGKVAELPGLSPEGMYLRYDPLVELIDAEGNRLGNTDRDLFASIATEAEKIGFCGVRTSVMTAYGKAARRIDEKGFKVPPEGEENAMNFIENTMVKVCGKLGLLLHTCVNPDRGDPGCISGRALRDLHPRGVKCSVARDRNQRKGCHCTKAFDIGRYYSCPHGCLYCYGNPVRGA